MLRTLRTRLWRALLLGAAVRGGVPFVVGRIDSSPRTSRRDFLRWTVAGTSTFILAEAAAGFLAFYWPIKIGKFGGKITVTKADIPAVGKAPIVQRDGKFWLINNEDGGWRSTGSASTSAAPCRGTRPRASSTAPATARSTIATGG